MRSDSTDTAQDASTYPTTEKQVQENIKRNKKNDVIDDKRSNNGLSTGSEDGRSTSVGRDQDSNASLESDTDDDASGGDEEIEDWIEYIERSTHEAEEKMKRFAKGLLSLFIILVDRIRYGPFWIVILQDCSIVCSSRYRNKIDNTALRYRDRINPHNQVAQQQAQGWICVQGQKQTRNSVLFHTIDSEHKPPDLLDLEPRCVHRAGLRQDSVHSS